MVETQEKVNPELVSIFYRDAAQRLLKVPGSQPEIAPDEQYSELLGQAWKELHDELETSGSSVRLAALKMEWAKRLLSYWHTKATHYADALLNKDTQLDSRGWITFGNERIFIRYKHYVPRKEGSWATEPVETLTIERSAPTEQDTVTAVSKPTFDVPSVTIVSKISQEGNIPWTIESRIALGEDRKSIAVFERRIKYLNANSKLSTESFARIDDGTTLIGFYK